MVGSGPVARTAVSSAKVAVVVSGEVKVKEVKERAKDTALRHTGINRQEVSECVFKFDLEVSVQQIGFKYKEVIEGE
jgi:hypothetical protein